MSDRVSKTAQAVETAAYAEVREYAELVHASLREMVDYQSAGIAVGKRHPWSPEQFEEEVMSHVESVIDNALIPYAAHWLFGWGLPDVDDPQSFDVDPDASFEDRLRLHAYFNFKAALTERMEQVGMADVIRDYAIDNGALAD